MCTITLYLEEETNSVVVGRTSDIVGQFHSRSCGHFRYPGKNLKFTIAFAGLPARYGEGNLPTEDLFSATENSLEGAVTRFAESIRQDTQGSRWIDGIIIIASAKKIFKISGADCVVDVVTDPFIVIGENSDSVEMALRQAEEWAGAYFPVMDVAGIIAYAITRAWATISDQPKTCTLIRYVL